MRAAGTIASIYTCMNHADTSWSCISREVHNSAGFHKGFQLQYNDAMQLIFSFGCAVILFSNHFLILPFLYSSPRP